MRKQTAAKLITYADALAVIRAANRCNVNTDPQKMHKYQWAREWSVSDSTAERKLDELVRLGKVGMERLFPSDRETMRPMKHYWVKK